jgi:GxxExxY protein
MSRWEDPPQSTLSTLRFIIGNGFIVRAGYWFGPGLLESTYEDCPCFELAQRTIYCQRQVPVPVIYKGNRLDCGYRIDILVEQELVVEVKSVERLMRIHEAQLLTYLRLSGSVSACS